MTYLNKYCTVQLERLHPYKFIQDLRERDKQKNQWYRDEIKSGFNLLMKWVPGTTKSSRPEILMKTVNYIQKLQEKQIEKAEKTTKYIEELEKKIKELETWQTPLREPYPSEPHLDLNVRTTSPTVEEELLPEEELLASGECTEEELLPAEEEVIADFNLELLASPLPELKSMEDFTQWLELLLD
jgi:hypothetical protein